MIYATVNMTVGDYSSTCDQNIVLYRGDKNVEIRFVIKGNRFTVLDSTYAQMIIRRPSSVSIFSEPAAIQNDTVILTITEDMIDELKEIGEYTFQIRLYDNSMNARATLPPCNSCLIINQPIAVEGEALVNAAMVNASAILAAESDIPEDEIFTEDNAYNRTVWMDGDIITDARMNKIENALYYINEKGGGGTATAPYISTSLPETVMVGSGEDFELDLDFSSPNLGKGTLKVFINDIDSMNQKIDQGMSITTIPGSLFSKGTNMVVIYVLDRVGMMSNSLTFYVRYGGTEVTSTFDAYTSYDYGATVRYYFTPTALDTSLQLTFYMEIDGTTQAGVPCISDVRSYYTFPTNLSVGNHYCRAWVTDGTTRSNVLTFNLIILDATSLVVATDTLNPTVEEGTQLVLDYKVYMKNNTSFITKTYVDNNLINTGTCTLETAYYRTTNLTAGTHTIKVEVFDVTETYTDFVTWTVTVTESTYTMLEPAKAGSIFMATAYNKSNVDENREVWIGSNQDDDDITASLSNFSFNSENGWIDDALVISGNSWVEIPIQPLANNAQYGFTLDIEFKTKAIGVEDAEVLTLWNETDNCGIKITTEQLIMRSKTGNQCDLYFPEDEIVSAIFVIDRDEKTAKIYLNGVMCEAFALSDYEAAGQKFLEDFTVNSNVYLGGYNKNGYCAIKNIRIYEVALATNEILNNFMSNEKDKAAQRELVEFQKGNTLPTLTIYCDFSGLGKDDKKPCNIVYNSPDVNLYGESFTLDGKYSQLQYQGTSSMQYPIKNYRINPRDENGKVKLDPFNNGVAESRFTLKADFMSSGHWQNTGMAKFVNDCLYNYNVNDEKSMNPAKWWSLQNGGSLKDTRETINGFPCRLILVNDGETALNEGQQEPTPGNTKDMGIFNFNNDKDNVNTLGLDTEIFPNCISYEVTANSDTSAGAFVPFEDSIINLDDCLIADGYYPGAKSTQYSVMRFSADSNYKTYQIPVKGDTKYKITTERTVNYNHYFHNTTALESTTLEMLGTIKDTIQIDNGVPKNYSGTITPAKSFEYEGMVQLNNGNYLSTSYVTFAEDGYLLTGFHGADTTRTMEIYDESGSAMTELEYLQNSFELRYPDSDDVGGDYGYLGMVTSDTYDIDYWLNGDLFTTLIDINLFPNGFPTFESFGVTIKKIACMVSETEWIGDIRNYSTATDYLEGTKYISVCCGSDNGNWVKKDPTFKINGVIYTLCNEVAKDTISNPREAFSTNYGLKRVIDWVGNCTDEEFVADFEKYFNKQYVLRYYLLVIVCGMVDNLGKNMMLDTWDGQIWYPRFYDMDTICSYDNSGEIKFDVDIEMAQGYWNTSSSRLWTKVRDLFHDELVETYNNLRQNNFSYEKFMSYFYDKQIAQIPQTYYNKDYDVKYAPYANEYMGKAHGDGYEHLKRWLKRRLIFTDTLFDYAPSYTNDALTIRANTLDLMSLEIETYTPVYQHVSFYNGNMEKIKIDGKTATTFTGTAQTATDQEVLIYGGSNIKSIKGIQSMNPNSMLIGNATKLTQLDISNCPILTVVNSNKANFSPHTYLNKLDISNCPQLGGQLNISNSPLLQELNALGSAVDNILFPTSVRNLETLRVPKTVTSLNLNDAGLLYTLEMEAGNNLQNISLTNCNNLTETINFDLTQTPTVLLDNSFNGEEIYMSATTNLTLKNMPSLKRVIFTPNSEYSAFDINNVLNGANYKITTFNNPMMTDFITTAPHRVSHKAEWVDKLIFTDLLNGHTLTTGRWLRETTGLDDSSGTINAMLDYIEVESQTEYMLESTSNVASTICFYDSSQTFLSCLAKASTTIPLQFTTPDSCQYIRFDVTNTITSVEQLSLYKVSEAQTIQIKDYGEITPNTTFTANTLDLADTQFQNVKFLCTTDIYNLKVPTTMKNFYCDSAMDIDTDVIEDASYEVIHEELIEPYTTNYDKNVYRYNHETVTKTIGVDGTPSTEINGYDEDNEGESMPGRGNYYGFNYTQIVPGSTITIPQNGDNKIKLYDENKVYISGSVKAANEPITYITPNNAHYFRFSSWSRAGTITYESGECYTPNLIPSSANGSLIFNMYSNNTTQPTSTSPYMWDLTGLKLNDFYTYGMNNWVKPSDDSYEKVLRPTICENWRVMNNGTWGGNSNTYNTLSPIRFPAEIKTITFESNGTTLIPMARVSETHAGSEGSYSSSVTIACIEQWGAERLGGYREFAIGLYTTDNYKNTEWIKITTDTGDKYMIYLNELHVITPTSADEFINLTIESSSGENVLSEIKSITMPQRMSGYSVRLVNADITPDEYPTMLYPKWIDTGLPITGKLDYTAYNGTSLAWAYAYTTGDVDISPLGSQHQGNITNDYNKLYGTDYVDIVDIWVYKDTDVSKLSTNEAITKAYIELTSANYKTRIDEVLQYYPNCTDLYLFEDGTVTTLADMFNNSNNKTYKSKIKKIEFMDGYFQNLTSLNYSFYQCSSLTDISNIPSSVENMYRAFYYCGSLINVSDLPDGVTNVDYTFYQCDSLVTAPKLGKSATVLDYTFYGCDKLQSIPEFPPNVTKLTGTFSGCSKLTSVPDIPNSVTDMSNAFYNCSRLVVAPKLPTSVHTLSSTFQGCSSLTTPPSIIPKSVTNASGCFNGCISLVTPPEFEHVDGSDLYAGRMYQNCSKMTTAPKIPNGVNNILGMFVGCSALTIPPTIPDSVTNMQETFSNCTGLTQNPNVPTGVTNLKYAFSNSSITAITIPLTNLTTYDYAISKCPNLTDVIWVGELTSTFNVKNLYYRSATDNTTPTATDIQELVPEHLGTVTGETLTLGDYISYLTEDEITQATNKGWIIE